jgi:peptidoglycan/xylan/chitin deacetylase (PgdA/CDA1 family)
VKKLQPGWYILLYHDVSWEESAFIRHIGGTCAPDVFRDHVRACNGLGDLVSIDDAMQRLHAGAVETPMISFWFDDGLSGVRRHAAPILEEYGLTAAMSVCSRFANRAEFFWRFKLSFLNSLDAGRHLRSRLRQHGYASPMHIRSFTIDRFGDDVLAVIDGLYDDAANPELKDDAFRVFETTDGLGELHRRGWTIANHSAAHYPIGEPHVPLDTMLEQFDECERFIQDTFGEASRYWVFPFDINVTDEAIGRVTAHAPERTVTLVRNRANRPRNGDPGTLPSRPLYRIEAPVRHRERIRDVLSAAAERSLH